MPTILGLGAAGQGLGAASSEYHRTSPSYGINCWPASEHSKLWLSLRTLLRSWINNRSLEVVFFRCDVVNEEKYAKLVVQKMPVVRELESLLAAGWRSDALGRVGVGL